MSSLQLRYVPRHIAHHGRHSGYDRLFEYMGLPVARSGFFAGLGMGLPKSLAWRLWRLRPQATQAEGLSAELGALPFIARGQRRLCHFIYGEDTWFYSPLWKRGGNLCIASYHYPPQRLARRINPGSVAALDAAIIISECQRPVLQEMLPPERVFLRLHAVDTDFFCPDPTGLPVQEPPRLVCAGSLFRDHRTLVAIHRSVRARGFDVLTDVISPPKEADHWLMGEPGVQVLRGLDDQRLLQTYRQASVGVLPLLDSTANNALLEMLACGLPVVSTDVGGVAEYTRGSEAKLFAAADTAAMSEEVCRLLADPARRAAQGQRNRQHAEQALSFRVQALQMQQLYEYLGALNPASGR